MIKRNSRDDDADTGVVAAGLSDAPDLEAEAYAGVRASWNGAMRRHCTSGSAVT